MTIVPKIPDPVMAGKGTERKEIMIIREARLKNLLRTKQVVEEIIEVELQKFTKEFVLSETLYFPRSKRNYNSILGILKDFLAKNDSRWVDLTFCYRNPVSSFLVHSDAHPRVFLFGKREFIIRRMKEISGRIVNGKRWKGREAGISPEQEFSIEGFI